MRHLPGTVDVGLDSRNDYIAVCILSQLLLRIGRAVLYALQGHARRASLLGRLGRRPEVQLLLQEPGGALPAVEPVCHYHLPAAVLQCLHLVHSHSGLPAAGAVELGRFLGGHGLELREHIVGFIEQPHLPYGDLPLLTDGHGRGVHDIRHLRLPATRQEHDAQAEGCRKSSIFSHHPH